MPDAKDKILAVLRRNGDWMQFAEIRDAASIVSLPFVADALKDFVNEQIVETTQAKKGKCWRAVKEPA